MSLLKFSYAQRYEIGLFAGGNNVIGDVGSDIYVYPNSFSGGGLFKWNVNPRLALRFNAGASLATGSGSDRFGIEEGSNTDFNFNVLLINAEALLEWNFFHYDLRSRYFNKTPYMTVGIGVINHDSWSSSGDNMSIVSRLINIPSYAISIPFGVGYKHAISPNWVVAADLMFRYSYTDDLDLTASKNVGNLNSNDWLTTVGITLTYVFGRDPCACGQ